MDATTIINYLAYIDAWTPQNHFDAYEAVVTLCIRKNGRGYNSLHWQECKKIIHVLLQEFLPPTNEYTSPIFSGTEWQTAFRHCIEKLTEPASKTEQPPSANALSPPGCLFSWQPEPSQKFGYFKWPGSRLRPSFGGHMKWKKIIRKEALTYGCRTTSQSSIFRIRGGRVSLLAEVQQGNSTAFSNRLSFPILPWTGHHCPTFSLYPKGPAFYHYERWGIQSRGGRIDAAPQFYGHPTGITALDTLPSIFLPIKSKLFNAVRASIDFFQKFTRSMKVSQLPNYHLKACGFQFHRGGFFPSFPFWEATDFSPQNCQDLQGDFIKSLPGFRLGRVSLMSKSFYFGKSAHYSNRFSVLRRL